MDSAAPRLPRGAAVKRNLRIGRDLPQGSLDVCETRILRSLSDGDGGDPWGGFRD
jgi:hypothetical protein